MFRTEAMFCGFDGKTPSMALTELESSISQLQRKIEDAEVELAQRRLYQDHQHLLDFAVLKEKQEVSSQLIREMALSESKIHNIASHIQQPFSGDYVLIDPSAQKPLHDMLLAMAADINYLDRSLSAIDHSLQLQDARPQLESMTHRLDSLVVRWKQYKNALTDMRITLQSMTQEG
ncbi:hypothetical protein PROFUN_08883 [Planoprotostelium fungivorum]|uniref:Uncharacterized protein n=1 Tax=Planoprotostelium fungivorum TaxID=1890364 RepID=A0A2P6NIT7_9EUKA|nr:hypothetical protein PROFUN_08883 [Planoprotostelium fungivorum]